METTVQHLFRKSHFVKLWGSQILQSFASILLQVIVMVEVYQSTDSILGSASVLAIMAIGSFVGGLVGSYRIHRFSLLNILYWSGWARALSTSLLVVFLSQMGTIHLFLLLLTLFFISFVGAWYQPARFALLPMIVSKREYMKANGTLNMIHQMFSVAGWGLGGILTVVLPFYMVVIMISVSFLLSGIFVRLIQIHPSVKHENISGNPESAWRKVFGVHLIRSLTMMDLSEALANAVWSSALILAFTKEVLNKGSEWWGFINAFYWLGGVLGSIIVVAITKHLEKRVGWIIGLSALAMAVLTLFFAMGSNAILALTLCLFMGPLYQARDICQETVLQDLTSPEECAGIMAARNAVLTPWWGITYIIMGWLADRIGIQATYILAAALYALTCFLVFFQPSIRDYQYGTDKRRLIS